MYLCIKCLELGHFCKLLKIDEKIFCPFTCKTLLGYNVSEPFLQGSCQVGEEYSDFQRSCCTSLVKQRTVHHYKHKSKKRS